MSNTEKTATELASDLLGAESRFELRERAAGWSRRYSAPELIEIAERLKAEDFERYLDDPRIARKLALGLVILGRVSRLAYVEALGILAQADAERKAGRLRVAIARFEHAAEFFLLAGSPVGWARARTGWVWAASGHGSLTAENLERMDEVCRLLEENAEHYHLALAHQNIALGYASLSRFPQAASHWSTALEILREIPGPQAHRLAAQIMGNLAFVELWQGNFETAFIRHLELRALFTELQSYADIVLADLKLSFIEQERGHLSEALAFAASGYEEAAARGLVNAAAIARLARANVFLKLNRLDEAATAGAEALAVLSAQHDAAEMVNAHCICAEALERRGDQEGALRQLEQAAAVAGSYSHPNTYRINLERAALLLRRRRGEDTTSRQVRATAARDLAREVAERSLASDVWMHHHMALLLQAEAAATLGSIGEAQTLVDSLLAQGVEVIGPEVTFRCQLLQARVARQTGGPSQALDYYDAMVRTLGGFVEELAYDRRADFLLDKDAMYLEALIVALDAADPVRALTYLERQRARSAWLSTSGGDSELESLRREHRGVSATLAATKITEEDAAAGREQLRGLDRRIAERIAAHATRVGGEAEVNVQAVLQAIPAGSVVVAYALTGDELITFVLSPGHIESVRTPVLATDIELPMIHLQARFDASTAPTGGSSLVESVVAGMRTDLQRLWSVLLRPVAALLPEDGGALLFVPHRQLHAIPFAALWDGALYCVERWAVQTLSSCHALLAPAGDHSQSMLAEERLHSLLALGYADSEQNLPYVSHEAVQVALMTGGTAAVSRDATLGRLRTQCEGRGYLHLAAHGAVRLDLPNSSYIELADGLFHPLDALTLPLHRCRLVVLSACETGLGKTVGGDEQVGLVRAFGLAGADTIVATLWRVNDAASMVLMELLYERLAAGASPTSALSAAQRAFISGAAGDALRNPYYWAGYQLTLFRPGTHVPTE